MAMICTECQHEIFWHWKDKGCEKCDCKRPPDEVERLYFGSLEAKIYSLETDVIHARRVADERQEIIKELSIALHFYADKVNWSGAFGDVFAVDQGYERAALAIKGIIKDG